MFKINRENILVYFLAFVLFFFGYQEVSNSEMWVRLVPMFMANIIAPTILVLIHGLVLIFSGLALIFNFYRKYVTGLVALMLVEIIVILMFKSGGLDPTSVRDIGLLGMVLALYFKD